MLLWFGVVAPCPEAGHNTNTKSRAWWISYSFSVNCSCPQSPFHPNNFIEVNFLSMPVRTISVPLRQSPASITSRSPCIFQPYLEKSDVTSESSAYIFSCLGLYKGCLPKSSQAHTLDPSSPENYFLITFLPGSTNHLPLCIHSPP